MSDDLLPYYEQELTFLKQSASNFAKRHPKIAGRLRISEELVEDPHVSRLLEGVAYLNSNIQKRLDDDLPEVIESLLNALYPHYLCPIPSTTIVSFIPQKDLDSIRVLPKGSCFETPSFQGETCQFTSCYPVKLAPVSIKDISMLSRPFNTPGSDAIKEADSVLRIKLGLNNTGISWEDITLEDMRFFIHGQPHVTNPIYDLLMLHNCEVVIAASDDANSATRIGAHSLAPVGYNLDEGLLPYGEHSSEAYRLLTEFFVFAQKFLYFDILNLKKVKPVAKDATIDIYIYLNKIDLNIQNGLKPDSFRLYTTPMINLFEKQAEPISHTHHVYQYPIIPDARRPRGLEVYKIKSIKGIDESGKRHNYLPFFGMTHSSDEENIAYWQSHRRQSSDPIENPGSEMYVSMSNHELNPSLPDHQTLEVNTVCLNRNLPAKLPFGEGQPALHGIDIDVPCSQVYCLTPPSETIRLEFGNHLRWRLLSHLNLNHFSLTDSNAIEVLKEILRLYDFKQSAATRAYIAAITKLETKAITAPLIIEGRSMLCRGTLIDLTFDASQLSGSSIMMYSTVLERFFALYCQVNSFTQLIVRIKGFDSSLKTWPPRGGDKALI